MTGYFNAYIRNYFRQLIIRYRAVRQQGYIVMGLRISRKLFIPCLALLMLPISVLFYLAGCRRLLFFTDRIGHLAIEPDTILKGQALGLIHARRWIVLAPKHRVANQHLLNCWRPYFSIFDTRIVCFVLEAITWWSFLQYDVSHFVNNNAGLQLSYRVNALWADRPPVLTLSDADNAYAETLFTQFGMPKDAWFVCVHAREGGFSPVDESLHAHRNGRVEALYPAIEEITRRGGWVVRLGDPSMQPVKKMPQVIDYPHHPCRSERADIILCAKARFILGNTSGIFLVASVFGVPCALVNMIPMPMMGFLNKDLSIPKLFRAKNADRYLTFNEVMGADISTYRTADLYQENRVVIEENSSDDILALTIEMLDRLNGQYPLDQDIIGLHTKYMSLFNSNHYAYGAASQVGHSFLRRYKYLLENA